jgi:cytochrome c556
MLRVIAVLAALSAGASVVLAQNAGVIAQRKEAMKAMGGATKGPAAILKGEAPFSADTVKASLKTIQENAGKVKSLFPDDTKIGDTAALPAVFEKKSDFLPRFDKLAEAAKDADGTITDAASLKTEWPKVVGVCGGCHKEYRKPSQ